jgi:hypothetical protein
MSKKKSKVDGFDGLTTGQWKAMCIKLGGVENFFAVLRGEKKVVLEDVIRQLIDKNGRRIPSPAMKNRSCDPNVVCKLLQAEIDYDMRLARLQRSFVGGKFLSVEDFKLKAEALLEQIRQNEQLVDLLKGSYFPVCFPQLKIEDYGSSLEDVFLPAVKKAYLEQFPRQEFRNYLGCELKGKVSIVEESRHRQLLDRMAIDPVVGIMFFPYSVFAQKEEMPSLPSSLLLCGVIDIAMALVAYLDILAGDCHVPGYDCSAVAFESSALSLSFDFDIGGGFLAFNAFSVIHYDFCSAGVLFLG